MGEPTAPRSWRGTRADGRGRDRPAPSVTSTIRRRAAHAGRPAGSWWRPDVHGDCARRLDQPLDLSLGQIFAGAIMGIRQSTTVPFTVVEAFAFVSLHCLGCLLVAEVERRPVSSL